MDVDIGLFSNAEPSENFAEDFVGGDFTGDGAEVGEGGAEVFCQKVGGDLIIKGRADNLECFESIEKCLMMAGVGYEGCIFA